MKKAFIIISVATISTAILAGCNEAQQRENQEQTVPVEAVETPEETEVEQDTIKGSIPSEAKGMIGDANVKINYYAPGVKGRIIWGGLVPYDQVWATGAHMATAIEFDNDLLIGEQEIPAGKYALFTIPGREEWTFILNRNWEQHLADDYDQKKDVLRVQVKPTLQNPHQERLKYEVKQLTDEEGTISMGWDDLMITVPVSDKR